MNISFYSWEISNRKNLSPWIGEALYLPRKNYEYFSKPENPSFKRERKIEATKMPYLPEAIKISSSYESDYDGMFLWTHLLSFINCLKL